MKRLSQPALAGLPAGVARPRYDRAAVTPGIVHLGVGAFHRGHQAVFVDDCLGRGETGWGIVAASLRSPATRDALAPQDNLYTYCERDGETETLRVIGSIIECLVAPEDPARLIERLADPRVRIVTLTVTEKGYLTDLSRGTLLADHPDILHDLENPDTPRTIHGYLFAASRRRREEGSVPLTLVSCDNLPSNGRLLQALFGEFARLADPRDGAAIAGALSCPCVMVDRIVPATTEADRQGIAARLGVDDAWPVVAEPYFRWVIEDRFPHGRPGLEKSGAEFVADVEPFEHMKLRMLNGAHTAIAAIGQVAGFDTVADTYGRDEVRRFIDVYWGEVAPTLAPEVDGESYVAGAARPLRQSSAQAPGGADRDRRLAEGAAAHPRPARRIAGPGQGLRRRDHSAGAVDPFLRSAERARAIHRHERSRFRRLGRAGPGEGRRRDGRRRLSRLRARVRARLAPARRLRRGADPQIRHHQDAGRVRRARPILGF
jgi:fructuronate reductase